MEATYEVKLCYCGCSEEEHEAEGECQYCGDACPGWDYDEVGTSEWTHLGT